MNLRNALTMLLIFCLLAPLVGGAQRQPPTANLTLCEVLENPSKYDGQRITVDAYYNYFFEMSWIFCWECKDKQRTWLEIPIDDEDAGGKRLRKELAKGPEGLGVVSARFTGVFHVCGGPCGHMGWYRNKFELQDLSQVKVVIQDTKTAVSQENCSCQKLLKH